jgi:CheY-like chemotaxis protein
MRLSLRAETKSGLETILLVEDEVAVRELVQRVLSRHRYTVVVAASGEEALQLTTAMSRTIDLLLTDAVMPRISGPASPSH